MADWIPVVPARGGAEAALGLYYTIKFFSSIELARAVRQPGPCVRVNFSKLLRCCPRTWLHWNDPSRTRRTQEVPFIASCSHFIHGKTQGFVLGLRPQNKVHATFMQPLQCDLHPHVANTKGEPITRWNDPSRTRRTQEVPFIARCSHLTRKNTRFRAPASSPKQSPCSHSNSFCNNTYTSIHYNAICIHAWQNTKGEPL